jgi:hypothetical protein
MDSPSFAGPESGFASQLNTPFADFDPQNTASNRDDPACIGRTIVSCPSTARSAHAANSPRGAGARRHGDERKHRPAPRPDWICQPETDDTLTGRI